MATLVAITVGPLETYKSLAAVEALNLDLVALDQYYEVTIAEGYNLAGGVDWNGWTTDATRYIHIKGGGVASKNTSGRLKEHGYGQSRIETSNTNIGGGETIKVSSIGANGRIIFENLVFTNSVNGYRGIYITQASAVTVLAINCNVVSKGGATSTAVNISGHANALFQAYNCVFTARGTAVYCGVGAAHLYNCTVRSLGGIAIDANNKACVIYNCYAVRGAAANALNNIGASTVTTTATNDATSPVGALQNITYDHTEVKSVAWYYGDNDLVSTSQLRAQGSTLGGLPAPFTYTTDIKGRARTVLTPDIGATEYDSTENPVLIERWVHATEGDYASMKLLADANIDLVTATTRLTIYGYQFTDNTAAIDFASWVTNSTYYLHIKPYFWDGVERGAAGASPDTLSKNYGWFIQATAAGAPLVTITDIGASGLIIFEGLQIYQGANTAGSKTISVAETHAGATVRFDRCHLAAPGNNANKTVVTEAGAACTTQLINCSVYSAGTSATGACLERIGGIVKAYHCSFICKGNNATVVDMNDGAGSQLVNCFAKETGAGTAYANLTNVTFTTCGASDATGDPAGLDNIAIDDTNFLYMAAGDNDWRIRKTSALLGVGTNLSGYAAPFNITKDLEGITRSTPPSIGCYDLPSSEYLGWTKKMGLPTATHDNIRHMAIGSDGYLYAFADRNAATNPPIVYHLTGVGDAWSAADYTHGVNARGKGLVLHTDNMIYALCGDALRIAKQGAPWSQIAVDYLGGMAGNPAYNYAGILSFSDGYLYVPHGNGGGTVARDQDGVAAWSNDTPPAAALRMAGVNIPHCMELLANGTHAILPYGYGYTVIRNMTTGAYEEWVCFNCVTEVFQSISMVLTSGVYTYFISQDPTPATTGRWNVFRAGADMMFKMVGSFNGVEAANNRAGVMTAGGIYFGSARSSGGTPYRTFLSSPEDGGVFGDTWFMAPTDFTYSGSVLTSESATPQKGIIWNGRAVFGMARTAPPDTVGILYSDAFTNALKLDDVDLEHGDWNVGRYSASIMARTEDPAQNAYTRMTLMTSDYSSAVTDWSQRYVRNYYTLPPANFWQFYRLRLDKTVGDDSRKEDAIRFFERVYKEGQTIRVHGPMIHAGDDTIPVAYVPLGITKAADVVKYSASVFLNSFVMSWKWVPTFNHFDLYNDRVFLNLYEDANNYIQISFVGNAGSRQREYNINDVYGLHEPKIKIVKNTVGVTKTLYMTIYYGYNGTDTAGDWFLNDTFEFTLFNKAGEIFGLDVKRGEGVTGHVELRAVNGTYAGNPTVDAEFSGYGVFSPPIMKNFIDKTRNTVTPRRTLPTGRSGVMRRLTSTAISPILVGDRDVKSGIINTDMNNPYIQDEQFIRADNPNLGDDWTTVRRTGAGFIILNNTADCAQTGWERWIKTPSHADYYVAAFDWIINNTGDKVGVFSRYDYYRDDDTCYLAAVTQTGANAADLDLYLYFEGTAYLLGNTTVGGIGYVQGDPYNLYLRTEGATIYASVSTTVTGSLCSISVTNDILTKPGRVGMYGVTGGAGNHVSIDRFRVYENFTTGVTTP